MFTNWSLKRTWRRKPLHVRWHSGGVADRQARIEGFVQAEVARRRVLIAGCGGLGSVVGETLVRKGFQEVIFTDPDTVEPSNLNRQKFYKPDLGKNKGICLARNLAPESFLGTTVTGIGLKVMDAIHLGLVSEFDVIVSSIDDELAREELTEYSLRKGIPQITMAISLDGDAGYVHVQKSGEACWGCAFPREQRLRDDLKNYRAPCPGTPAIRDILMVVGGAAVYALDTLFMPRPISWNYREFHLAGFMPDVVRRVARVPNCHLCGPRSHGSRPTA